MTEQDRADFEAWARSVGADAHKGSEDLEWSPSVRRYTKVLTHNYYLAWLAARRTQDAKVRELVEAAKAVIATITTQTPDPHSDVVVDYGKLLRLEDTLAQLKEAGDG